MELRNKKVDLVIGSLFFLLTLSTLCLADSVAVPHSYAHASSDNRYIFVMLSPKAESDGTGQPTEVRNEALRLRKTYKESGLYRNDGSLEPLWTVNWYSSDVLVSSDGSHLIRMGPWASSTTDEALTFFDKGKEIRSYAINELVDFSWLLPHTVSHFTWKDNATLDDSRRTLILTTLTHETYVFDITTGKIVSTRRLGRRVIAGALVIGVLIAGLWIVRQKRSEKTSRSESIDAGA